MKPVPPTVDLCAPSAFFIPFRRNMLSIPVPVRIPTPSFEDGTDLKQLAQITTPDGILEAFWMPDQRNVVVEYSGAWYLLPDCNIVESIGEIVAIKASKINLESLTLFEGCFPHSVVTAGDDQDCNHFYDCDWSDYACDHMAFQANLHYPYDCRD